MRETKNGPVVDGDGWFVVNARDSRWREMGALGAYCNFEGKRRFPQLGINLNVLGPGERIGMYHRENAQEGFLVLAGECTLVVEDEERQLAAWDSFHCPPGTPHIIVAAEQNGQRQRQRDAAQFIDDAGVRGRSATREECGARRFGQIQGCGQRPYCVDMRSTTLCTSAACGSR